MKNKFNAKWIITLGDYGRFREFIKENPCLISWGETEGEQETGFDVSQGKLTYQPIKGTSRIVVSFTVLYDKSINKDYWLSPACIEGFDTLDPKGVNLKGEAFSWNYSGETVEFCQECFTPLENSKTCYKCGNVNPND